MVVTLSKLDIVKSLKVILKHYMFFLHIVQRSLWNSKSLLTSSTPRATNGSKMSKPIRSLCFFSKKHIYVINLPLIVKMHEKRYESKVVSKNVNALHDINFILGSLAFVLCLNVCMHWSTLHKTRVCLCAIFLSLSSWPNKSYIDFIMILLPSMRMKLLIISIQ